MQPNSITYFNLYALMAKQSPLNALRQLEPTVYELRALAVILRAIHEHSFAEVVQAEADMRQMLKGRGQRCLN